MQRTSWEMLDWKKHKLESRLWGEISYTAGKFFTGWAIRTSVKCYYPIGLLTAQKRLPLVQSPPSILWGYTLCHSETGKDVFKADDNKNNLLVLVKSTNGFFFLFSCLFILFLLMGMRPVWAFPGCSVVKNLSAKQETQVLSLGQEDPVEKGMATDSSILAWKIL